MKTLLVVLALANFPTWMSGTWQSSEGRVRMEEHWTSAEGDVMLGLHRDIGKKTSFEFMRIERQGDTLVYMAMPGGRPATAFPLKSATADRIVFENPEHDFPQRIIYWRDGEKLCARVEGTMNGKESGEQWCWSRVR